MTAKTIFCSTCEGRFKGIMNELFANAEHFKRSQIVKDAIYDLWCSIEEGNIHRVRSRDRKRKAGSRSTPRRLEPHNDFR